MKWEEETGFFEMVLNERIDALLKRTDRKKGLEVLEELEAIISGLSEEQQEKARAWQELSADMEAEDQRKVYLGGLSDGIWLAGKVYLVGLEDRYLQ